jgi:hypothetical protein
MIEDLLYLIGMGDEDKTIIPTAHSHNHEMYDNTLYHFLTNLSTYSLMLPSRYIQLPNGRRMDTKELFCFYLKTKHQIFFRDFRVFHKINTDGQIQFDMRYTDFSKIFKECHKDSAYTNVFDFLFMLRRFLAFYLNLYYREVDDEGKSYFALLLLSLEQETKDVEKLIIDLIRQNQPIIVQDEQEDL